jgi:hypothetical protein
MQQPSRSRPPGGRKHETQLSAVRASLVLHRCESEVPDGVERGAGATASCPGRAGYLPSAQRQVRGLLTARGQAALSDRGGRSRHRAPRARRPGRGGAGRRLSVSPELRFATVAARWLARFEAKVAAGERRERTLEAHRYHLERHLPPALGRRLSAGQRRRGCRGAPHRPEGQGLLGEDDRGALATLHSIVRFALRNGWLVDDPGAGWRPMSARVLSGGASGCWAATRSEGYWPPACPATAPCSRRRSTRVCGSPSCSGSSGTTSTSWPA